MEETVIEHELIDSSEKGDDTPLKVKIKTSPGFIELCPEGYGSADMQDGFGAPIALEFYEGRLRLIIHDDINSEEGKIIDMQGAKESERKEE